jgi:hypothetical protein
VKIEARPNMQLTRERLLDANITMRNARSAREDIGEPGDGRVRYIAADFDDG